MNEHPTALLNQSWAKKIVNELFHQGVEYFCLAPGSRCTPLALAIAEHPQAKNFVHFDERGMAFHALGYAKATNNPVALIVTSGTAVGNLFPALMEASLARVPLIILTADRPHELRGCGANQTLDQTKIFGDFVRWYVDLPCPQNDLEKGYLATTIAQAVYRARSAAQGPVHLNCPFREPLSSTIHLPFPEKSGTRYAPKIHSPDPATVADWVNVFNKVQNGLIVVGALPLAEDFAPIYTLAEKLGWPIFADINSGMRSQGEHPHLIRHFDPLLKAQKRELPELVLHLGGAFVSKTLLEWLHPTAYYHVGEFPERQDPKHRVTDRMECDPLLFAKQLFPLIRQKNSTYLTEWQESSSAAAAELPALLTSQESLSEPELFYSLRELLSEQEALFIASSMPIRDADNFFYPEQSIGPLFANRGVSGIDGNIATAVGIAQGCKKPVIAIVGDQTFLHDLNSLSQMKKAAYPVILVVINNGGGGIFSFLPVAEKKEAVEEYFAAAHAFSFSHAAALFDLSYAHTESKQDWKEMIATALKQGNSCLIEVTTNRQENYRFHQEIQQKLCSLLASPVA